jgi:DegV family protein with EDD domain
MQKIKIITDSTIDIPSELIEKNDIEVMPLLINFGEDSYLDGVEITPSKMIERINKENVLPTTAQITPIRFEETFKKYLDQGYKIITLLLSSEMSGTYQSACIAKEILDTEDIIVIDSRNVSSGLGLLTLRACKLRDNGASIQEIEEELIKVRDKIKCTLNFESLDNLVRGGRLPKVAGAIGTALGLRLILEIKDGKIAVKDKVRGSKKALKKLISDFESSDVDFNEPIVLLELLNEDVYFEIKNYFEEKNIEYIDGKVGCAVGIHSGIKPCGIFFTEK